MRHRKLAALVMSVTLLSGCLQEEAPWQHSPAAAAAWPANLPAGVQRVTDIGRIADAAIVPELATRLRDDTDPELRREAVYLIADLGETEDAAIIGEALYDPDGAVRLAAIEALTGIGGDTSRLLLQQALADADHRVREAAQQMLDEPVLVQRELK